MTEHRRDSDIRLDVLETKVERIVVILEGEPAHNIAGNTIGSQGGLVALMHKIDRQTNHPKRKWSRSQKIAGAGVGVTLLLGVLPSVWGTIQTFAQWVAG